MTRAAKGNVFITGAATGIGAATTRQLAEAGYQVFAGVHQEAGALARIPGVQSVAIDVTDPSSVENAAKVVDEATGGDGLRAVINNAGVIVQGPLELVPASELRRQFEVNTLGPAHVIQAFLPLLRTGKGRIINISAPTARVPVPFMAPIGGSKAALASFSDSLRLELSAWGIPVTVIEPGGTDTAIFHKAETAARATLGAADPAKAALYSDQLAAVAKAAARQKLGPADAVAKTIVAAVEARKPKRRYAAGSGTAILGVLAHVPASLAYSRTKLANLLFSYELQRRHPELSVAAVHPGMVRTDLGRHWPRIQVAAMHAMSISARKGAESVVSLGTAPAVERGAYYNRFTATRSSPESYDPDAGRRLWEITEALRGPFGQ
jgi:NAD(P)-dependent dehydrogenase (short-subunit alcohol dehydrogenase family)